MNSARFLCLAVVFSVAMGCGNSVLTVTPLGEEVALVSREEWEGLWLGRHGVITIQVTDESAGELRVSWIERSGSPATLKLEAVAVQLRRSGDWLLANLAPYESDDWIWLRVKRSDDELVAWMPNASAFSALVSQGVLPGAVKERSSFLGPEVVVTLGKLTSEHHTLITTSSSGVLLEWEDPLIFVRLRDTLGSHAVGGG